MTTSRQSPQTIRGHCFPRVTRGSQLRSCSSFRARLGRRPGRQRPQCDVRLILVPARAIRARAGSLSVRSRTGLSRPMATTDGRSRNPRRRARPRGSGRRRDGDVRAPAAGRCAVECRLPAALLELAVFRPLRHGPYGSACQTPSVRSVLDSHGGSMDARRVRSKDVPSGFRSRTACRDRPAGYGRAKPRRPHVRDTDCTRVAKIRKE